MHKLKIGELRNHFLSPKMLIALTNMHLHKVRNQGRSLDSR